MNIDAYTFYVVYFLCQVLAKITRMAASDRMKERHVMISKVTLSSSPKLYNRSKSMFITGILLQDDDRNFSGLCCDYKRRRALPL